VKDILRLDCVGMRCPRPIIELAKAARKAPPGTLVEVRSDDLAFESDVTAWCDTTQASLVELQREGPVCIARIRLRPAQEERHDP